MIGLQLLGPYPEVRDIGIFYAHFMFTSKTKKTSWLDIISTMRDDGSASHFPMMELDNWWPM